ncbi:hypothetical protein HNQ93_000332 [Hymenobacter luteus]|uniref:Outer membrane protein beta-barrel domain-containing protein n=2 Tax=Hymenobacter TaxID=89966 RepID=A0A7W9WBC8_9BACT|nr:MULTISPECIES: porin family protein [Hymenobacter]MBB4600188.1 hypothetical protein [Hymenobacter latericoloratus]MBB6057502.1 hypothetical protein [Hymenobacter luteus]
MISSVFRTCLTAGVLLGGALTTQAQVTIGPRIGLNASTLNFDIEDDSPDTKSIYGPQVGLTLNAQFGHFSLQPSLLFSQKGARFEEKIDASYTDEDFGYTVAVKGEEKVDIRLNYLEIPVNLVYNTSGEEGGFQVFAGPYVGIGLNGQYKAKGSIMTTVNGQVDESSSGSSEETEDIKFVGKGTDGNEPEFRRIDFGINAGLGYKAGPFQAQLGYGLGLGNLIPKYDDDDDAKEKIRNRGVQLSVAYFFGGK